MDTNEAKTWKNIQQKDEQIFEAFYKEHYKAFFLVACHYVKFPEQAQEIVNDVFLKLWQDGDKLNITISLKSYIYRAVINSSINAVNKYKKDIQHKKELCNRDEEIFLLQQMDENELKIRLYAAIDELPEQCRKVFRMSRFEELKQQEIADKLGISIKTVKNHITHAIKRLSKVLDFLSITAFVIKIFLMNQ